MGLILQRLVQGTHLLGHMAMALTHLFQDPLTQVYRQRPGLFLSYSFVNTSLLLWILLLVSDFRRHAYSTVH